jgi:radical SAM protein with 4Fe4S-binding SPASM domain
MTKMPGCRARQIHQPEFTRSEIDEAVRGTRLLAMEVELGPGCSFHGPDRGVPRGPTSRDELSQGEVRGVVLEAKDLGARRITILGGEPSRHPHVPELIRFVGSQGLDVEMFTEGTGITADFAKELFEDRVRVVLRMDSLDENTQDLLTGTEGSFKIIQRAFRRLKEAGYPSEKAALGVNTVIGRHNIGEIVTLWRWLRDQDIVPYLEFSETRGNTKETEGLHADPTGLREVLARIAEIERDRYGRAWAPMPPLWGNGCMRHKFSCLLCPCGDVMPCVGLNMPIGNIRENTLSDIIEDSEVLEDLRDHIHTIKGPCASCSDAEVCYGCRGAAHRLTGDYLASDPLCWKNADRQDEIASLPFAADEVIPQKRPMRIIDDLVKTGDRSGEVSVTVSKEMPFVGDDGVIDESAYFEMMAQSIAAINGFKRLGRSQSALEGFLVGVQEFEILGPARVGDTLNIHVQKKTRFGKFGILKGTVSRNGVVLARGEIKTWEDAGDVSQTAGAGE